MLVWKFAIFDNIYLLYCKLKQISSLISIDYIFNNIFILKCSFNRMKSIVILNNVNKFAKYSFLIKIDLEP